jgi:hypothetical protein
MNPTVTTAESQIISAMVKAGRELPDEFLAVGALQELATLFVNYGDSMDEVDRRVMIGIGGFIANLAATEMGAEVLAKLALRKARG